MNDKWKKISSKRREYGVTGLSTEQVIVDPIMQFKIWLDDALAADNFDPTAMVLSTVDALGQADSRVVLLKELTAQGFVFYTNYQSNKGSQLAHTPYGALNFFWPIAARQVRIRGNVKKTTACQSDAYFNTRPQMSQLSSIASAQSQVIQSRAELELKITDLEKKYQHQTIPRPAHWGGYLLIPDEIEFWQGRDCRLHDRLLYLKKNNIWFCQRLAP